MSRILKILLLILLTQISACYHMRAEPEPIAIRIITIPSNQQNITEKIRKLLEEKFECRILEANSSDTVLITAPYRFITDTSFGQPPGGRKYYTQLRIEIHEINGVKNVELSHYNFEIRTTYAYNSSGHVGTMYKHYPYEKYPGMFDLNLINQEMDRVSAEIMHLFKEYK